ncbi:MAG: nuclear transport factor 2 family protein [Actinomycetota bacterium]|nr:nuclear transport factor 2 family protein [Actinomycetota bacterium]
MPRDYVSIVRGVYEEWGRGNFLAGTELFDQHTILVLAPEFPESGAYRGPEEINRYMRGFLGAWDHLVIQGESFTQVGDSVVVGVHQQGAGRESGTPGELRYFQVWSFRGPTLLRMENIFDERALKAVGLPAETDGP